jgi:hypothetical protein
LGEDKFWRARDFGGEGTFIFIHTLWRSWRDIFELREGGIFGLREGEGKVTIER